MKHSFTLSSSTSLTVNNVEGFSLIEVIIFIAILSMFLVTAAAIITVSMHQNSLQINKVRAVHYNDQLLEWLRSEKDRDWNTVTEKATSLPGGSVYCFCTEDVSWATASIKADKSDCCPTPLSLLFKRYVALSSSVFAPSGFSPSSQIEVTIDTDWQEAGNSYSTKLHTIFTPWEE